MAWFFRLDQTYLALESVHWKSQHLFHVTFPHICSVGRI